MIKILKIVRAMLKNHFISNPQNPSQLLVDE